MNEKTLNGKSMRLFGVEIATQVGINFFLIRYKMFKKIINVGSIALFVKIKMHLSAHFVQS